MLRRLFRYFSACVMLMLYVAVWITGDIVALTCECKYHKADEYAAFRRIYSCESGCCTRLSQVCHDVHATTLSESCSCSHSHSTEIALYLQPRLDDGLVRQAILLAALTDAVVTLEVPSVITSCNYSEYCLPALASVYVGIYALRAPPVLV